MSCTELEACALVPLSLFTVMSVNGNRGKLGSSVPVSVFPPLYGRFFTASITASLVVWALRCHSIRGSPLYWAKPAHTVISAQFTFKTLTVFTRKQLNSDSKSPHRFWSCQTLRWRLEPDFPGRPWPAWSWCGRCSRSRPPEWRCRIWPESYTWTPLQLETNTHKKGKWQH